MPYSDAVRPTRLGYKVSQVALAISTALLQGNFTTVCYEDRGKRLNHRGRGRTVADGIAREQLA